MIRRKVCKGACMGVFLLFFTLPLLALASFLLLYLLPGEAHIFLKRLYDKLRDAVRAYLGKVDALFEDLL